MKRSVLAAGVLEDTAIGSVGESGGFGEDIGPLREEREGGSGGGGSGEGRVRGESVQSEQRERQGDRRRRRSVESTPGGEGVCV